MATEFDRFDGRESRDRSNGNGNDRNDSRDNDRYRSDDRDDDDRYDDDDDGNDDDERDDSDSSRRRSNDRSSNDRSSRSQSRALRRERSKTRELQRQIDELRGSLGKEKDQRSDKPDLEALTAKLKQDVSREYEDRLNSMMVVTEAIDALRTAGVRGNPRRIARLLDLESVDIVNGRVNPDSLADVIDDLREDSPELFRQRRATQRDTDADERLDREDDDRSSRRGRRPRADGDYGGSRSNQNGNGRSHKKSSLELALEAMGGGRSRSDRD